MLPHETASRSFRVLGWLELVVGLLLVIVALADGAGAADMPYRIGAALGLAVLGIIYLKIAGGLKRQEGWARTAGIVFSCLMLIGIPLGTVIGLYLLYYLNKGYPTRETAPAPGMSRPVGGLRR